MRQYFLFLIVLVTSFSAYALQSMRIGNQLLVIGDSAARVKALMGEPSVHVKHAKDTKSSSYKRSGKASSSGKGRANTGQKKDEGEKWQYRRDGHTTIFTIVGGKIAYIEDLTR